MKNSQTTQYIQALTNTDSARMEKEKGSKAETLTLSPKTFKIWLLQNFNLQSMRGCLPVFFSIKLIFDNGVYIGTYIYVIFRVFLIQKYINVINL
jgi:hypothetical protein